MVFDWGFRCFSVIEGNNTNKWSYALSFLDGKHRDPQSINTKLFLPIIPIGNVAYAFPLLCNNLCWNSCKLSGLLAFAIAPWRGFNILSKIEVLVLHQLHYTSGLKTLAPLVHQIASKTKTNRESLALVSRALRQELVINSFEFWLVHCSVSVRCDWLEWLL